MKNIRFLFIHLTVLSCFSGVAFAQSPQSTWNGLIIRAQDGKSLSHDQLIQNLSHGNNIILGEKHYTPAVQDTQAAIISGVVKLLGRQNNFTTAWEFLNYTEQSIIQNHFEQFVAGKITAADFLTITQGDDSAISYASILEATKENSGQFIGVNLPRSLKSPVVKNGIGAADPRIIPPGFSMGSQGYHERFVELMGNGHASPEMVENYYAAQCLTDDVMAYHLLKDSQFNLRFLIVGSFHTDFFDGTVGRINARSPGDKTFTVRIIDASDYSESELLSAVRDPKYGDVADFVYFVNEPSTPQPKNSFFNNREFFEKETRLDF